MDNKEIFKYGVAQQNVIENAIKRKYDQVEEMLKNYTNYVWHNELYDNIARIATLHMDKKLFKLTNSSPRKLLAEYAPSFEHLKFLVDCYKELGWEDPNGIPSYVWEKTTLESAKYLEKAWGTPCMDNLYTSSPEVKEYFGWTEACENCGEREDCKCGGN